MIVIATDSTAYLTKQEAKDLGVLYIPMTYSIGGQSYEEGYVNEEEDKINEDEALLTADDVYTSQPVMGSFLNRFSRLLRANCEILCLTLSSRLSGTYNNAMVCARELGNKGIRVIDTQTSAGGMFLMIKEARALVNKGYSLHEVADLILKMRDKIKTYFSVTDLTRLRRSGRLGSIRQSIATILSQRPIFTCKEGTAFCCGMARGYHEQIRKLVEVVPENAQEVTVQYYKDRNTAEIIASKLKEKFKAEISLRPVGPVLGIYLGANVIGTLWKEL